jgi:hypothetical protein
MSSPEPKSTGSAIAAGGNYFVLYALALIPDLGRRPEVCRL